MARGVDQQDGDKTNILIQVFWICLAVLESNFEHEFLLGLRLLDRVLDRLPLDRPDVREKVEKLHVQVPCRLLTLATCLMLLAPLFKSLVSIPMT